MSGNATVNLHHGSDVTAAEILKANNLDKVVDVYTSAQGDTARAVTDSLSVNNNRNEVTTIVTMQDVHETFGLVLPFY